MNPRRKALLVALAPLLLLPFIVGAVLGPRIGQPEMLVWLVLLAAWLTAFLTWGRANTTPAR